MRATRANVQHCEEQVPMQMITAMQRCCVFRSIPIGRSRRHRKMNGGGGPFNDTWVAGVFSHGGWTGVTKRTLRYPQLVRYLSMFIRSHVGEECGSWSSRTLLKNHLLVHHHDLSAPRPGLDHDLPFIFYKLGWGTVQNSPASA